MLWFDENAAQRAQIAELVATIAKLTERVEELLAAVKRKGRRPEPEKKPVSPPPTLGDEQKRAFENRPAAPEKPLREKPPRERPP